MKDQISLDNALRNIQCAAYVFVVVICGEDRMVVRITKKEAYLLLKRSSERGVRRIPFVPIGGPGKNRVMIGGWAKREVVL